MAITILKNKNKVGGLIVQTIKTFYKATVTRQDGTGVRNIILMDSDGRA